MTRTSASVLAASLLFAVGASQAAPMSHDTLSNGKSVHGEAVPATQGVRLVNVDAGKAVNVNCGDVVTFQSADKRFTWKFNSVAHNAIDLRSIAPAGFTDKALKVYIARSDAERG